MSKIIRVSEQGNGECVITSEKELSPESEFAIKSLAGLQLLCMGRTVKSDAKLLQVINILEESCYSIEELYKEINDESIEFPNDYD